MRGIKLVSCKSCPVNIAPRTTPKCVHLPPTFLLLSKIDNSGHSDRLVSIVYVFQFEHTVVFSLVYDIEWNYILKVDQIK